MSTFALGILIFGTSASLFIILFVTKYDNILLGSILAMLYMFAGGGLTAKGIRNILKDVLKEERKKPKRNK